jgi:hypothetical protein
MGGMDASELRCKIPQNQNTMHIYISLPDLVYVTLPQNQKLPSNLSARVEVTLQLRCTLHRFFICSHLRLQGNVLLSSSNPKVMKY